MLLLFRTLYTVIKAYFRSKLQPLETATLTLRVWPNDIDINRHLNNGRYLSLMDLGRFDWTVRMGLLRAIFKYKWHPVVASAHIQYFRSLRPFQKFQLKTRMLYLDEKWVFMEQTFEALGKTVAIGRVKALFLGPSGKVPTQEVIKKSGHQLDPKDLPKPDSVKAWEELE